MNSLVGLKMWIVVIIDLLVIILDVLEMFWIKLNVDLEKVVGLGWIEICIVELLKLWNIEICYMFFFINWLFDEVKLKCFNLWINNF